MKKLVVMLPAYNEEENIGELIENWENQKERLNKSGYELKVNVINDCSTDNTQQVVEEKKKKFDNVEIIKHEVNKGLSGGLNTGITHFNKNAKKGDLLVFMDADNTHDPKYVHEMIEKIEKGKDCVIASRYKKNSDIVGLAKNRELMSDMARLYYTFVLKIPNVKDYTCGYRVYTYDIIDKLLKKYKDNPIKEKSFACMMEFLFKVYKVGAKFDEVGFVLRYDNKKGESKMRVIKTMKRSVLTAIKLKRKEIFIKIVLILLAVFLSLGTNYSPINNSSFANDCSIFSYIGMAMKEGRILYTEAWENKGPLLYFIYEIGQIINQNIGVYLLELLAIYITMLYSYKTIKIAVKSDILSLFGLIYVFSIYPITYEGGTLSENFALPFIAMGLYYGIAYFYNDFKISNTKIVILGILTGCIGLLRLNILSIFLALFLVIGLNIIKNKEFKEIGRWLKYGIIGFVISILPISLYLIINNAMGACLDSAYFGIMSGFETGDFLTRLNTTFEMLIKMNVTFTSILMILAIIVALVLIILKKVNKSENALIFTMILSIIINIYANSISGALQMHYMITFIPVITLIVAFLLSQIEKIEKMKNLIKVIIVVFITLITINTYIDFIESIIEKYNFKFPEQSRDVKVSKYIEEHSDKDDTIQMIGGSVDSTSANYKTKRLAATKYNYVPLWGSFTNERKREMVQDLLSELYVSNAKIIMVAKKQQKEFYELIDNKEQWQKFLDTNYDMNDKEITEYIIYNRK